MTGKADYVRRQPQTRAHACHWPGCSVQVPPAMWGCRAHWARVPRQLRRRLWNAYRPGQEVDLQPSSAYVDAAAAIQRWIQNHLAHQGRGSSVPGGDR